MKTLADWCEDLNEIDVHTVSRPVIEDERTVERWATLGYRGPGASFPVEVYDADLPAVGFLKRLLAAPDYDPSTRKRYKTFPLHDEFSQLDPAIQRDTIIAATAAAANHSRYLEASDYTSSEMRAYNEQTRLDDLITHGLTIIQPWSESSLLQMLDNLKGQSGVSLKPIIGLLEKWGKKHPWTGALAAAAVEVSRGYFYHGGYTYADERKLQKRLERLCVVAMLDQPKVFELKPGDAWTDTMVARLSAKDESDRDRWATFLAHCETAKSSSPSKTFLKKAKTHIEAIGEASYVEVMGDVVDSVGTAYSELVAPARAPDYPYEPTLVDPAHADLLRGLVWSTSLVDSKSLLAAVAGAADRCFQKVRNVGPRSTKIGNACLWGFSHSESLEAVAQLNRLLGRVKHASVRKQIERSLNAAAEHHGLSRSDLEDMAVPNCGLTEVGAVRQSFGDYTATLSIASTSSTKTEWQTPAGKTQKTVPKAVKEEFAAELKAFKANDKLLKQTLTGQRDRLESFYLANKTWTYAAWRERVADHPLMGWLARRLIWNFQSGKTCGSAIQDGDRLVTAAGENLDEPGADDTVTLWHPIDDSAEGIQQWREWMLEHEITQPFKQAYREVYLLTDAERNTETYSNRFAAHVIKQHQFRALCQARGWNYDLMGQWDSHNTPEKVLPAYNLRAEFWVEDAAGEQASEMGVFLYLATDQVRFYECDAEAYARDRWRIRRDINPLPLDQIPPIVLSEIMRDVDLFVGVASVGNDPNWNDGGPEGRYREYWYDSSFGDLSATAQTRREILERLVPRLKIADRCSFDEKFLIVRGDRRTYKIHLGSSNILMEPNDQYLCIVPGRGAGPGDKVFLPFEGDQRLAVILSKAMMLAEDTKIKDPTILSQIGR